MNTIPDFSQLKFDRKRAMELANLIAVAYDEYEIWDTHQQKQPQNTITSSTAYVRLPEGSELPKGSAPEGEKPPSGEYGRLDPFWLQQPQQMKQYSRIENFWFTEWWLPGVLNFKSLGELLQSNLVQFPDVIKKRVQDDQLFGFIARSQDQPNEIFVVFRGTRESAEWFNNFRLKPQPFLSGLSGRFGNLGEVRNGFELIYSSRIRKNNLPTIEETIAKHFENGQAWLNNDTQIYVTGHSLGAGLATLAALHIQKILEARSLQSTVHLYTFASPRVGDRTFASYFHKMDAYRIINSEDLIQAVPLPTTQIFDDEILNNMNPGQKARVLFSKKLLETITKGQSIKQYQHVGIPITFTTQTESIAGNHNLTRTYREALKS